MNGSNLVYSLASTPTAAGIDLYLNGLLASGASYSLSGNTITLAAALVSGETIAASYRHT